MKKKTLTTLLTAALLACTVFTGCGKEAESAASDQTSSSHSGNQEEGEGTQLTLSEIINGSDCTIWYSASAIDKDKCPQVTLLYKDGTYISSGAITDVETGNIETRYSFGELSKMTDEEIIDYAERGWESQYDYHNVASIKEEWENIVFDKGFYEYYVYYAEGNEGEIDYMLERMPEIAAAYHEQMEVIAQYFSGTEAEEQRQTAYDDLQSEYGIFWVDRAIADMDELLAYMEEGAEYDFEAVKADYIAAASAACDAELKNIEASATVSYDRGTYQITAETDASGNIIVSETIELSMGGEYEIEYSLYPQAIYDCYYGGFIDSNDDVFVVRTSASSSFSLDTVDTEGITID